MITLEQLSKLGVWIRLHYLYPYPSLDKLLPFINDHKILPYLDVPLQHVNKRILNAMRRPGDKDKILERILNWRKQCPELTIRSSFIVGFPGETRREFNELIEFLKIAKINHVGAFQYSNVKWAAANKLPKQVSEITKKRRQKELMLTQKEISTSNLQNKVGQNLEVIIDSVKPTNQIAIARSYADAPDIDGRVIIVLNSQKTKLQAGQIITVAIEDSDDYDLYGSFPT